MFTFSQKSQVEEHRLTSSVMSWQNGLALAPAELPPPPLPLLLALSEKAMGARISRRSVRARRAGLWAVSTTEARRLWNTRASRRGRKV